MSAKKGRSRRSAEPQRVRETVAENNVRLKAKLGKLLKDQFKDVDWIVALEKKLAATQQVAAAQFDTMADSAKVVTELSEKLVATEQALDAAKMLVQVQADTNARHVPELVELKKQLVAEERECDFWIDEAERFRNQVVELLRERATLVKK